ncbi:MAG: glycine cleavage system aminomethyltransferase GcvT [Myxococcota bacterium]
MSTENLAAKTPLYGQHQALKARMTPFAGWMMPIQYRGVVAEHQCVRNRVGLFDVSHMGELRVSGSGAVGFVDHLVTGDLASVAPGRALYTLCCNSEGCILDDLIVYRTGSEELLIVCNASNREKIDGHFREALKGQTAPVAYKDASQETALLALQGPLAATVLDKSSTLDLEALRAFDVRETTILHMPCTIARTGYTGEDGFELFCSSADAETLWDHLLESGQDMGIEPIGLGARDTLRLEARLSLYGNEIDESTHPFEAGLGWTVKLDRGPFLGREALRTLKETTSRKLVGFEMIGRGTGRQGYPILDEEGNPVGTVTSGCPSPTLGKSIGLGYVPKHMAKIGTSFEIGIRHKVVEARVVKTPFYKRQK